MRAAAAGWPGTGRKFESPLIRVRAQPPLTALAADSASALEAWSILPALPVTQGGPGHGIGRQSWPGCIMMTRMMYNFIMILTGTGRLFKLYGSV